MWAAYPWGPLGRAVRLSKRLKSYSYTPVRVSTIQRLRKTHRRVLLYAELRHGTTLPERTRNHMAPGARPGIGCEGASSARPPSSMRDSRIHVSGTRTPCIRMGGVDTTQIRHPIHKPQKEVADPKKHEKEGVKNRRKSLTSENVLGDNSCGHRMLYYLCGKKATVPHLEV